jgi:hypothetical protein
VTKRLFSDHFVTHPLVDVRISDEMVVGRRWIAVEALLDVRGSAERASVSQNSAAFISSMNGWRVALVPL